MDRASLWRMYRASVYHLGLHVITTDYRVYKSVSNYTPSVNNFLFAVSVAEDYAVRGRMKSMWPGLLLDSAYASKITSLRFKNVEDVTIHPRASLQTFCLILLPESLSILWEKIWTTRRCGSMKCFWISRSRLKNPIPLTRSGLTAGKQSHSTVVRVSITRKLMP